MDKSTLPKEYPKGDFIPKDGVSKVSLKLTPDELTMYEFIKSVVLDSTDSPWLLDLQRRWRASSPP